MGKAVIIIPEELKEKRSKLIEKIKDDLTKKEISYSTTYTIDGSQVKVRYNHMTYTAENLHLI